MIIGDYNVTIVESDKKDGHFFVNRKVHDFKSFITKAGLCDVGFIESKYS